MQGLSFCLRLDHGHMAGLNEKLGRHGGREGKSECTHCTLSIVRVLYVCQLLVVHVVEPFCGRILV